jgi:glycosyltransferase involved in cell wall biosynthesis
VDVAHVSYWPPRAPRSYNQTAGALVAADLGFDQVLICSDVRDPSFEQPPDPGLVLLPSGTDGRIRRGLHRFSRRSALDRWASSRDPHRSVFHRRAEQTCAVLDPSVVLVWDDVRLALRLARRLPTTPVVLSQRGTTYGLPTEIDEAVYRSDLLSGLVLLSEAARRACEVAGPIVPAVAVIPNVVDTDAFRPAVPGEPAAIRRKHGLPAGPTALYVGRLAEPKGVHLALEAWVEVRAQVAGAHLVVVGHGDDMYVDRLRQRAAQSDLAGSVLLLPPGSSATVAELLRGADLLVFPTLVPEGMPKVVIEAMSSGVPIVGHDFAARAEMASPADGLIWTPPDAPGLLAAEIVRLLSDPARRAELAISLRAVAETKFSFDRSVGDHKAFLSSVRAAGRQRGRGQGPAVASDGDLA